jgi:hypothetical protein
MVTLTGSSFVGSLSVSDGPDITVSNVVVVNSTSLRATFSIASTAKAGPRNVTVTTEGGTSNAVNFTVSPYPAKPCSGITANGNVPASSPVFTTIAGSSVTAGQYARIVATGCIGLDATGGLASPQGSWRGAASAEGVLPGKPRDGVVCKIGDGAAFYVGKESVFTAVDSGAVACIVNEDPSGGETAFADNTGFWTVTVTANVSGQQPCSTVTASGNVPASSASFTDVSGSSVVSGHVMLIEASGCVTVDTGGRASPAGSWRRDAAVDAVVAGKPLHGLVCRIGTGAPFYVGSSLLFTATESGTLSCIVNEEPFTAGSFADNSGSWTVSVFDVNGRADLFVGFGGFSGSWIWSNNSQWASFNNLTPERMVSGDFDGNGKTDVVADLGGIFGIWIWYNSLQWVKLHDFTAQNIVAGDLDGNGQDDLIIDFGAPFGLWIRYNNATWAFLNGLSADHITLGDFHSNGTAELAVDFGAPYGIWIWSYNAGWTPLHSLPANRLTTGDVDGNGKDDLIVDFAEPYGVWIWSSSSGWTFLNPLETSDIVAGDLDGNGQDDLIIDFGPPLGLWIRFNNSSWTWLHPLSSASLTTGDLDGDGKEDLTVVFGNLDGLWIYFNNSDWTFLHPLSATRLMAVDVDRN